MGKIMPVLFIGHGSPMNAIEDNEFTGSWGNISKKIPKPKAILAISAHYEREDTSVTSGEKLKTIHDFYGFPQELYDQKYDCSGSKELVTKVKDLIKEVNFDSKWGIDHGVWCVLSRMYPDADIPVVELSINRKLNMQQHYDLARKLYKLREEGILIFCTGNVVHNLMLARMSETPYKWATSFDENVKKYVTARDDLKLVNYESLGEDALLSVNSAEHYIPLIYALGATDKNESVSFFCEKIVYSSVSMRCILFEGKK
ncbi:4,5-DOPA dioxygenase extradiol [Methanosarcina sp. KYL-1]|uniref:4,5-DOPA-extradiol-dioxygenase n=1 Tax=Methanosarcina sp. KYL-1 TaxID=2602068 RepID=UPI002100C299|nr:4,5-DOPA dioxygenase extradiol [Methanosarcina sp. KYL-1]MCQ1534516.1 4,5-DOPA dioxygenase extradiol [Methanosarcina sp. KYL-1]